MATEPITGGPNRTTVSQMVAESATRQFGILARCVKNHASALRAGGFRGSTVRVELEGFQADVCLFRVPRRHDITAYVKLVVESAGLDVAKLDFALCLHRDARVPVILPEAVGVTVDIDPLDPPDPAQEKRHAEAVAAYQKPLRRLSQVSGRHVHFHSLNGYARAPFPDDTAHLHLFSNLRPHGESRAVYVNKAFGLKVEEGDKQAIGCQPAAGRGLVLKDGDTPLVQVLGNNAYLLLPTLSVFHEPESPLIFSGLLALAWNGAFRYATRAAGRRPAKSWTRRSDFIAAVTGWTQTLPEQHRRRVRDLDERIENLQKDLAEYLRVRRELLIFLEGFAHSPSQVQTLARLPQDYRAIMADPLVAGIDIVADGLQVQTNPIVIEHEGRSYDVGDFVIRISRDGAVSIWPTRLTHPDGVPHPHIAKDGGPCFGNATDAIARAGSDLRIHDTIRYVLSWLKDGYTPALAAVKIETWPAQPPTEIPATAVTGG